MYLKVGVLQSFNSRSKLASLMSFFTKRTFVQVILLPLNFVLRASFPFLHKKQKKHWDEVGSHFECYMQQVTSVISASFFKVLIGFFWQEDSTRKNVIVKAEMRVKMQHFGRWMMNLECGLNPPNSSEVVWLEIWLTNEANLRYLHSL